MCVSMLITAELSSLRIGKKTQPCNNQLDLTIKRGQDRLLLVSLLLFVIPCTVLYLQLGKFVSNQRTILITFEYSDAIYNPYFVTLTSM